MKYSEMTELPAILTEYVSPPVDLNKQSQIIWELTLKNLIARKIAYSCDILMIRNYSSASSQLISIEKTLSEAALITELDKINPLAILADKLRTSIKAMAVALKSVPAQEQMIA